jgi:hypothetical protein
VRQGFARLALARGVKLARMKARIRELLHARPFVPFVIRMADGRDYRIEHPDFVLAASSDVPQITIEEPDGRQHFLSALLVTSVERGSPVGRGNGAGDE